MQWGQFVGCWFVLTALVLQADDCHPDDSSDCLAAQEDMEALSASTLLLQAGLKQSRGASKASQPSLQSARAAVQAAGVTEVALGAEGHSGQRPSSKALVEAAMRAAALAVAEEAAAAEAAGGGKNARLLASTRLDDTRHLDEDEEQAVTKRLEDMGLGSVMHQGLPPQGGFPAAQGSPFPAAQGGLTPTPQAQSPPLASAKGAFPPANPAGEGFGKPRSGGGQIPEGGNPFAHFNPFDPFHNPYWNPFVNPFANPFAPKGGKWYQSWIFIFVCSALAMVTLVACGVMAFSIDDGDDSSGDEDSDSDGFMPMMSKLSGGAKDVKNRAKRQDFIPHGRTKPRKFCCGLCGGNLFKFFVTAVLVTIFGCWVLWNTGILQPLLAQLLLYTYVIVLVMVFVGLILVESTRGLRQMFQWSVGQLGAIDTVIPKMWRKSKGAATLEGPPRF